MNGRGPIITQIIREVAELPDRTSPEDRPEMMLVSCDELEGILEATLPAETEDWQPIDTAPKDQEVEVRGRWKLRGDGVEFTHWRPLVAEQRENS